MSESISHLRWLRNRPALVLDRTVKLQTVSERDIEIDVLTGTLLSANDSALWKRCDALVYAGTKISAPKDGVHVLARPVVGKGTLSKAERSQLTFTAVAGLELTGRSALLVCLSRHATGWQAEETLDSMWNKSSWPERRQAP